ncbi:hypothetical protein NPX13_g10786 [Xylaria arbuscula]|uniref:Uncharacterized protein n=1 Tax=Xylaria arbuscula TaxID=114810 RepID=A0A9W8N457_9PEZI|nr:hypothetical protein NPX13_g10786 [Xylaria arbuscula]
MYTTESELETTAATTTTTRTMPADKAKRESSTSASGPPPPPPKVIQYLAFGCVIALTIYQKQKLSPGTLEHAESWYQHWLRRWDQARKAMKDAEAARNAAMMEVVAWDQKRREFEKDRYILQRARERQASRKNREEEGEEEEGDDDDDDEEKEEEEEEEEEADADAEAKVAQP